MGVSHLDLINWTNRLKWLAAEVTGNPRKFNAIAFYLDIAGTERLVCSIDAWSLILILLVRYVGKGGPLGGGDGSFVAVVVVA